MAYRGRPALQTVFLLVNYRSHVSVGRQADVVQIEFWDHAENSKDALKFEVIGRVFKITRKAYLVRCWGYASEVDRAGDGNADNENWFAIVKSTVETIKIFK